MTKFSRRGFLVGGAAATGAIVGAVGGAAVATNLATTATLASTALEAQTAVLKRRESFYGKHQNGVELELQSHTNFIALDLHPETDIRAFERWMNLLTDDIARLTAGVAVVADPQPELTIGPARLTVTVGFGPEFFIKMGLESQRPAGFEELPAFKIDRLKPQFSGGDVLLHVSADDPLVLSHAIRALLRDSVAFASIRWSQQGFSNAQGVVPSGVRQRNLMGQVDGTDNPALASEDFDNLVWVHDGPAWMNGGTTLVLRRIAMQLNTWDQLGRDAKEQVIGRNLENGAPLGGKHETDPLDFEARDANGLKVIPDFAHVRRASAANLGERIFRRPFNYEGTPASDGTPDVGLLWTSYQRSISRQYLPIQRRLDQFDLLNKWTVPIGSAVFAIGGGLVEGETFATRLLG